MEQGSSASDAISMRLGVGQIPRLSPQTHIPPTRHGRLYVCVRHALQMDREAKGREMAQLVKELERAGAEGDALKARLKEAQDGRMDLQVPLPHPLPAGLSIVMLLPGPGPSCG